MEDINSYGLNDFSSILQLLTGLAIVFSGYNSFVKSYTNRFIEDLQAFLKNRKTNQVKFVSYLFFLEGNPKLSTLYSGLVSFDEASKRRVNIENTKSKRKLKKFLSKHFKKFSQPSKAVIAYTGIYGIIVLLLLGFVQHDIPYLLDDNSSIISSKRAFYKIIIIYSFLSLLYLFIITITHEQIINNSIFSLYEYVSFLSPQKDTISDFTKSIIWSTIFLLISILYLALCYKFKLESNWLKETSIYQWLAIYYPFFSSLLAFFIVIIGYPLLYLSTFVRFKIYLSSQFEIFSEYYKLSQGVTIQSLFLNSNNYEPKLPPKKINIYLKNIIELYGMRIVAVTVLFIFSAVTFIIIPNSHIKEYRKIISEANSATIVVFKNYNSLSQDSIKSILNKNFILNDKAHLNVIATVAERGKRGFILDDRLPNPKIVKFDLISKTDKYIVLSCVENWVTHWENKKTKEDLWYNGSFTPQIYILKRDNGKWKVSLNYFEGAVKYSQYQTSKKF